MINHGLRGRKVADWLLRGFIHCANVQVIIARSITASARKFGGCGYDDATIGERGFATSSRNVSFAIQIAVQ